MRPRPCPGLLAGAVGQNWASVEASSGMAVPLACKSARGVVSLPGIPLSRLCISFWGQKIQSDKVKTGNENKTISETAAVSGGTSQTAQHSKTQTAQ